MSSLFGLFSIRYGRSLANMRQYMVELVLVCISHTHNSLMPRFANYSSSHILPAFVNSLNTAVPICVCVVMASFHAIMVELNSCYSDHMA